MGNNYYNQFQNDVTNTASNLMTQLMCAERGIDYNQVVMVAQQNHVNGVLQMEQQKQLANLMKRHYQGGNGGFMSKVKEVFSSEPAMNLMPGVGMQGMNMGMGMPMAPIQPALQQPTYQPPAMTPAQSAQFTASQSAHPGMPDPAFYQPAPVENSERIDNLEKQLGGLQEMIENLAKSLAK